MHFPIGSMSVGDILDRGLKLLFARLGTYYAIQLIVQVPAILYVFVFAVIGASLMGGNENVGALVILGLGSLLLLLFQGLVLAPIGTAATLHIVSQEYLDVHVGLREAFGFALSRFPSLLGASILAGLAIGVGLILCLVPGILFAIWLVFVSQIVVVERMGAIDALGRSMRLTEGHRLRIFGIGLLLLLIVGAVSYASGLLQYVLPPVEMVPTEGAPRGRPGFGAGPQGGAMPIFRPANWIICNLVSQLVGMLAGCFMSICLTLLYFDTRIRKEGFDLEVLAQRSARGEGEPPPAP